MWEEPQLQCAEDCRKVEERSKLDIVLLSSLAAIYERNERGIMSMYGGQDLENNLVSVVVYGWAVLEYMCKLKGKNRVWLKRKMREGNE